MPRVIAIVVATLLVAASTAEAQCNGSWTKTQTATASKRRVILTLNFVQASDGAKVVSTLDVGVSVKRRFLRLFWINTTADEIRVKGEYGGPRSPIAENGTSGYKYGNPFDTNYSSTIRHFEDFSPPAADCYSMTAGSYTATALFSGGTTVASTVSW